MSIKLKQPVSLSIDDIIKFEEENRIWDAFQKTQKDLKKIANKLRVKCRILIGDEVNQVVEPREWQKIMLIIITTFLVFLLILPSIL